MFIRDEILEFGLDKFQWCCTFQTNPTIRRQSHDSGLESILGNTDAAEGTGQAASTYVNTSSLVPATPGTDATSAGPGVAPRRPPKTWRENPEEQQAYLNQPGTEGSGSDDQNLIDLDEDLESGDIIDERESEGSGFEGKATVSTTTPGTLVDKVTKAPAVGGPWSPEVRGVVERPPSPFDVYVELRHSDGLAPTRFFWMDRCTSQAVLTRTLRRDDYFCVVSYNLLFIPVKSVCGVVRF